MKGPTNLNNSIDWLETQSSRGENQNRPQSSGYNNAGGPVGGATNAAGATGYPVPSENPNNILNANTDASEQDNGNYPYPPMVGATHNGAGGDNY
jgi:pre-mRNA-splicing factor ATP-dependent RNA helicase DHX38/PRP16